MKRVAIITGVSSGVGAATAAQLVAHGHAVVVTARRERELRAAVAELPADQVEVVVGDLARPELATALVEAAITRFGRLDTLINNAGIAQQRTVESTSEDLLQATFAINVFAPARLITAAWPHLRASGRGVIVNVSSMAAVDPFDGFLVYGASKAAVESFARSIVREGRPLGIETYTLRLGAVETPLLRSMFDETVFPKGNAHPPIRAAQLISECVEGQRKQEEGGITLLS